MYHTSVMRSMNGEDVLRRTLIAMAADGIILSETEKAEGGFRFITKCQFYQKVYGNRTIWPHRRALFRIFTKMLGRIYFADEPERSVVHTESWPTSDMYRQGI